MAWPKNRKGAPPPPDPKQNAQDRDKRGEQDASAAGVRRIAKHVEDKGGFWGPREDDK